MLTPRRTVSLIGLAVTALAACALPAQAQESGDRIKCHTVIVDVPPNMHPGFTVCPPA
jgi:hypothetical protein